jgi:hypothetical protein
MFKSFDEVLSGFNTLKTERIPMLGTIIRYSIKDTRYYILYDTANDKAYLLYEDIWDIFIDLNDNMDDIPSHIQDFILFNLDLFI